VNLISDTKSPIKCLLSIILALGLLFSFGLHAVQIEHEHFVASPAHGTHEHKQGFATLDTYMHLSDKKMLIFLPVALLALTFFSKHLRIEELLLLSATRYAKLLHERYGNQYRIFDYAHTSLRKGLMHSKAY
jgi:hypothetical protein